jgi:hypothetical protein
MGTAVEPKETTSVILASMQLSKALGLLNQQPIFTPLVRMDMTKDPTIRM